jgi:hypothetical protein
LIVKEMDKHQKRHRREPVESPEDIAYILDTVSDKIPAMIKGIIGTSPPQMRPLTVNRPLNSATVIPLYLAS